MTRPSLRIRCAVCDKLVDKWRIEYSPSDRSRTLTVWCHGAADAMVLHDCDLQELTRNEVRQLEDGEIEGLAFSKLQLEKVAQ